MIKKKELEKGNPSENGDNEYKFDDLLGSNVKTFISTHDAVLYCQKQLSSGGTKSILGAKSTSENSAEIKYERNIEIISVSDKKTDNQNGDLNIIYQDAESPVNNGNQTSSVDDDARLQSHVRNRFVNIPNAEKPLQTNPNGNEDATAGSSNNETYSE